MMALRDFEGGLYGAHAPYRAIAGFGYMVTKTVRPKAAATSTAKSGMQMKPGLSMSGPSMSI